MLENQKNIRIIAIALIVILGFIVYSNSLNGQFIWDDNYLIKKNIYIKNWSHISKIFSEDIGAGGEKRFNFYRPLQMITYALDYSLWKLNVKGYHLTNVLLHILVALAIYWLISILYTDSLLALFTGVFFVVHPVHTEAISYISGRADPLAALFVLLCLIFYVKYLHQDNPIVYILMILSSIFAILSKEASLILPLLLLLYHYTFKRRLKIKVFLPVLSIAFFYILLRLTLLRNVLYHTSFSTTLFQRIPGFFVAIANYIALLLLPFDLHMEYGIKLFPFSDSAAILGSTIFFLLLIYAFTRRNNSKLVFFSICWFFIGLLPVSNIFPVGFYMAEHWLYLPSLGFFLILAKLLCYIYRTKKFKIFATIFTVGLLSFFSYLTINQNKYWREPIAFYERTLECAPDTPRIYNNLGLANSAIGEEQEAIAAYKKAIEINPTYAKAYNNLAVAYHKIGEEQEAIAAYKKAIEINPTYAKAYKNLALTYKHIDRIQEAIAAYKKAIEIDPVYVEAYHNLAILLSDIGFYEEAIVLFKQAIEFAPDYADLYYDLAVSYFRKKDYELAIKYYDRAEKLGSIDPVLSDALKPYRP